MMRAILEQRSPAAVDDVVACIGCGRPARRRISTRCCSTAVDVCLPCCRRVQLELHRLLATHDVLACAFCAAEYGAGAGVREVLQVGRQ
jgi:hypothetical protein